jgi:hypothetical protein
MVLGSPIKHRGDLEITIESHKEREYKDKKKSQMNPINGKNKKTTLVHDLK